MKCPRCGMEVADTGRFCENCGAPLGNDRVATPRAAQTQPSAAPIGDTVSYGAPQQEQPRSQHAAQGTQVYAPYDAQPAQQQPFQQQPTQQQPFQQQVPSNSPTSPAQPQGSNAPFVLAIIALVTAILGMFPVSLVLAIIALAMNSGQKKRGEYSPKQTPTFVMGLISLILSILMAAFTAIVGGAVWLAVIDDDIDLEHITESTAPAAVVETEESSVGTRDKSEASSASAAPSYTDIDRPKQEEFGWITGKIRDGAIPEKATVLTQGSAINGEWKAYIEYKDYSGDVVVYDLLNIDIEAGDRAASITFDWYKTNYGDGWVDNTQTPIKLDGTFDSGSVSAFGDYANVLLDAFYESDGKQYGLGSMMLPSGEMADIFLVRP